MPTPILTHNQNFSNTESLSRLFQSQDNLFLKKGNESTIHLDEELKNNARDNDDLSIEILFTLAFEDSPLGKEAETFLFDLYTGKESKDTSLHEQLSKDSLRLYEIVEARNAKKSINESWKFPDKLLIMAGFSAPSQSELRADVAGKINQNIPEFSGFIDVATELSEGVDSSLFDLSRLVTWQEISAVTRQLNELIIPIQFIEAKPVSTTDVDNKECAALISEFNDPDHRNSLGKFIPLLFRGHWVLFGVSKSTTGNNQAILFDSKHNLADGEKAFILELSRQLNANEPIYIDQDIQTHLPNACGLLVSNAQEWLAENPYSDSATILSNFSNHIAATPAENQEIFNRQGRAELYGNLIDLIRDIYR